MKKMLFFIIILNLSTLGYSYTFFGGHEKKDDIGISVLVGRYYTSGYDAKNNKALKKEGDIFTAEAHYIRNYIGVYVDYSSLYDYSSVGLIFPYGLIFNTHKMYMAIEIFSSNNQEHINSDITPSSNKISVVFILPYDILISYSQFSLDDRRVYVQSFNIGYKF